MPLGLCNARPSGHYPGHVLLMNHGDGPACAGQSVSRCWHAGRVAGLCAGVQHQAMRMHVPLDQQSRCAQTRLLQSFGEYVAGITCDNA